MKLIEINLLPYREWAEQRRKKQFQFIMLLGALLGIVLCALIYVTLAGMIANQDSRNRSLEDGIKRLDQEIAEVKDLETRRDNLLQRKLKIEELDNKRFEGARIIDSLDQLVPDGAYLISLRSAKDSNQPAIDDNYTITGKAISDNKVATFMTALPSTGVFDQPQLVSIRKTDDGQEFVLTTRLLEAKVSHNKRANNNVAPAAASQPSAQAEGK